MKSVSSYLRVWIDILIMDSWVHTKIKTKTKTHQKEKTCWAKTPPPKKPTHTPTPRTSIHNPTHLPRLRRHLPIYLRQTLHLPSPPYHPIPTFLRHNLTTKHSRPSAPAPRDQNELSSSLQPPAHLSLTPPKPSSRTTAPSKNP